jgi:hypothetical protein
VGSTVRRFVKKEESKLSTQITAGARDSLNDRVWLYKDDFSSVRAICPAIKSFIHSRISSRTRRKMKTWTFRRWMVRADRRWNGSVCDRDVGVLTDFGAQRFYDCPSKRGELSFGVLVVRRILLANSTAFGNLE